MTGYYEAGAGVGPSFQRTVGKWESGRFHAGERVKALFRLLPPAERGFCLINDSERVVAYLRASYSDDNGAFSFRLSQLLYWGWLRGWPEARVQRALEMLEMKGMVTKAAETGECECD